MIREIINLKFRGMRPSKWGYISTLYDITTNDYIDLSFNTIYKHWEKTYIVQQLQNLWLCLFEQVKWEGRSKNGGEEYRVGGRRGERKRMRERKVKKKKREWGKRGSEEKNGSNKQVIRSFVSIQLKYTGSDYWVFHQTLSLLAHSLKFLHQHMKGLEAQTSYLWPCRRLGHFGFCATMVQYS